MLVIIRADYNDYIGELSGNELEQLMKLTAKFQRLDNKWIENGPHSGAWYVKAQEDGADIALDIRPEIVEKRKLMKILSQESYDVLKRASDAAAEKENDKTEG